MSSKNFNRRDFVKIAASSLAAIPLVVTAEVENKLSEQDAVAVALGYLEDSSKVDSAKYPTHQASQLCSNCTLYTASDENWGACAAFPGKHVAADGWCAAYAAKPS